jgi:alpha-L-fucosidase
VRLQVERDENAKPHTENDAEQWVKTAKEAQMGYILFLTKHHDGFCLWDTKTTERKVTMSPLGRDVLRELRAACDKHGIKLALYFSEGEWDWPNKPDGTRYQANGGYNPDLKKAQLRELLTDYGPVEYIWFDHAVGDGGLSQADTIAFCNALQPSCFVGFNHGDQAGADIRLRNIFSLDVGPDYAGKLREVDVETLRRVGRYIRGELKPPPPPISQGKPARASSTWRGQGGFDAAAAFDGDPNTRWGAGENSRSGWLEVDLGQPTHVARAVIDEGNWGRIRQFEVQAQQDGVWKTIASGTTIGPAKAISFPPVTARLFRLNILNAVEVPTICEFQLHASP